MSAVYLEHRDATHVVTCSTPAEVDVGLERAAAALAACDAWVVSAGAGMGVDSGLPAFRGTRSIWKDKALSMSYEEMSDDKWFAEDPAFAWGVNYVQLEMYRAARPHAGYDLLRRWAETLKKPFYVFTSNVDGHFEKAGFEHSRVVTCHGDLHHLQCTDRSCGDKDRASQVWAADAIPAGLGELVDKDALRIKDAEALEEPWFRCPRCAKLARPNVWFCRDKTHVSWEDECARRDAYNRWIWKLQEEGKRVVFVECGGGMDIPSVRIESEDAVDGAGDGSLLIRVNPTDFKVPAERAVGLPFGAKEGLERLDAALKRRLAGPDAARRGGAARKSASPAPRRRSAPSPSPPPRRK